MGGRLLAQQHRRRVRRGQRLEQHRLGLAVGDRDQVAGAFLGHLIRVEGAEPRHHHLLGDPLDEAEHVRGLHGSNLLAGHVCDGCATFGAHR